MIPQLHIRAWKMQAPWQNDVQNDVDTDKIVQCYKKYIEFSVDKPPTQKQFLANMEEKITSKEFADDIYSILKKGVEYDNEVAWELVRRELVEKI
ncbi:hypothetical protein FACS1894176_02680 [Bacteroidia bacterium]|nr:hypothetical protein FACS1894176_02680 [Bacteroidia bacterium]